MLVEPAARQIVADHFLGGKNIAAEVVECQTDSAEGPYMVSASITWSGALFSSNKYQIDALLRINGGVTESAEILRGHDNAQELTFWGNLAGKTVEVVSAVR